MSNRWKEFFCPLPCSTAGRITVRRPVGLVDIADLAIVIGHNCRLYCIFVFIPKIAFARWIVNVFSTCTRLCWPSTPQLSSHPWSLPEYHPVWVLVSCVLGVLASPVCLVSQSHSSKFFPGSGHRIGQGRRSCPCTANDQLILLSDLLLWRGLLLGVVPPSVSLPRYTSMSCVAAGVSFVRFEFVHFDAETFAFLRDVWKWPFPWILLWFRLLPNVQEDC